ncbi:Damage-inducible protein DinB [Beijerinckiaceae bacterium RH AL1]|nr:damage-inducible protein DinB [Beijerinckiaceae bacterium]VVB44484.1 Damage-inducible protein DinB [Beijerinckiaceae bacterium RH CH11]VVB44564.1 Damage-inducible protein DinB [Beijerinckiaceae bacterium RH AL8]VVC54377.1 Damage-inducible protein DinB [Beijerinckiaceae bacterium RH AL1]
MISLSYVQLMAAYNAEMNRRVYAAAGRLDDAARREDRGAFWHSIHGTLSHLVWGDRMWMSRFAGWTPPPVAVSESDALFAVFEDMAAARAEDDRKIEAWAAELDEAWLEGDLTWFSGAAGRAMTKPRALLVMHFFNHQTHHRGQAHAMLTAAGETTGATDIPMIFAGY